MRRWISWALIFMLICGMGSCLAVVVGSTAAQLGISLDDASVFITGDSESGFRVAIPEGRPRIPQVICQGATQITQAFLPDSADKASATVTFPDGKKVTITFYKDKGKGFVLQYNDRYTFTPSFAATSFVSSNSSVASVSSSGVITVKAVSNTPVTITASNGSQSEQLVITKTIRAVLGIWLLAGQSNAEGAYFDLNTTLKPKPGTSLYYGLTNDGTYMNGSLPGSFLDMVDASGKAVIGSMDAPLAASLYDKLGEKVLMVSRGIGGTSIESYVPGATNYNTVKNTWNAAKNMWSTADFQSKYETRIRSYFWIQGEADCNLEWQTYVNCFTKMHESFRGDFGLDYCFNSKVAWRPLGLAQQSRRAQEELAKTLDTFYMATRIGQTMSLAEGTYREDNLHFNQAGKNLLGPAIAGKAAAVYCGADVLEAATGATAYVYQTPYNQGDTLHVYPGQSFSFATRLTPISSDDPLVISFRGDDIISYDGIDWMVIDKAARDGDSAEIVIYSKTNLTTPLMVLPVKVYADAQAFTSGTSYNEYRWDFDGTLEATKGDRTLRQVAGNSPTFVEGSIASDSATYYELNQDIVLDHRGYWSIEFRCKDLWYPGNMLLSSGPQTKGDYGNFMWLYYSSYGVWDLYHTSRSHCWWNTEDLDVNEWHTYRLEMVRGKYSFYVDGEVYATERVIGGHSVTYSDTSLIHYVMGGVHVDAGNTARYGFDGTLDYLHITTAPSLDIQSIGALACTESSGSGQLNDPYVVNLQMPAGAIITGKDIVATLPAQTRMLMFDTTLFSDSVSSVMIPTQGGAQKNMYLVFCGPDETNSVYYKVQMTASEPSQTAAGECGSNAKWKLTGGALTLSGRGAVWDYAPGEAPWYAYKDNIRRLVIEDGITYLGSNTMYGCAALQSVNMTPCLDEIGVEAFAGCSAITDVYFAGGQEDWNPTIVPYEGNMTFLQATLHLYGGHEHIFGPYVYDNNASCTSVGTKSMTCSICGLTKTQAMPGMAPGHTNEQWVVVAQPTDTEPGREELQCGVCHTALDSRELAAGAPAIEDIVFTGYVGYYDGAAHTAVLSGAKEGDEVTFSIDGGAWQQDCPAFTDLCHHEIRVRVIRQGYATWYATAVVKIQQVDATKLISLAISSPGPQKDGDTFNVLWNCLLTPDENFSFGGEDIQFTSYGIIYAKTVDTLKQYAAQGADGSLPQLADCARITYDENEDGLTRVYQRYAHLITDVPQNSDRCAMTYLRFRYNGKVYELYSAPEDASTLMGGLISGIGQTQIQTDTFSN